MNQISEEEQTAIVDALEKSQTIISELPQLLKKASALVDHLAAVETQHGGLLGRDTIRAANELRLELSRWK